MSGVTQAHIARIENGTVDPRLSTFNRIIQILSVQDRQKTCREIMNKNLISITPHVPVNEVISIMHEYDISQVPVINGLEQVGSVDESTIIKNMERKLHRLMVKNIMDRPFPMVDSGEPAEIAKGLLDYHPAVLVAEKGRPKGIITKVDLLGMR